MEIDKEVAERFLRRLKEAGETVEDLSHRVEVLEAYCLILLRDRIRLDPDFAKKVEKGRSKLLKDPSGALALDSSTLDQAVQELVKMSINPSG